MNSFLSMTACDGRKPVHLESPVHHPRPTVLKDLLRNRSVVRFIIAPTHYGKTAVALEYAEQLFGFEHVFWIDAQNPCFFRDLDSGILAPDLAKCGGAGFLAVFEDVPPLDERRATALGTCFDDLLEKGWEVVVTAVPSARGIVEQQPDCICIQSLDLLVDQAQAQGVDQTGHLPKYLHQAHRISRIMWAPEGSFSDLLQGTIDDDLPTDALLAIFIMMILGSGELDEIDRFSQFLGNDSRRLLERDYLLVGVDRQAEEFNAVDVTIEDIAGAFKLILPRLVQESLFPDADGLIIHLADALLFRGQGDRACSLMINLCSASNRFRWLEARGVELFDKGCIGGATRVFKSKASHPGGHESILVAHESWRAFVRGDREAAIDLASRTMQDTAATDKARLLAAFLLDWRGEGAVKGEAACLIEALNHAAVPEDSAYGSGILSELLESDDEWRVLIWTWYRNRQGVRDIAKAIEALTASIDLQAVVSIALAYALESLAYRCGKNTSPSQVRRLQNALDSVGVYLDQCAEQDICGTCCLLLLEVWEKAHALVPAKGVLRYRGKLDACAETMRSLLRGQSERSQHSGVKSRESGATRAASFVLELPRVLGATVRQSVPTMRIRLFGGLDVSIGGKQVDPEKLRRQKVKVLLAILALDQGKEIIRDRLAELLWPESHFDTARRNFYSTWSILRRALSVSEGDCPYLARLQYSCMLSSDYVTSDVAEFNALQNKLFFDEVGFDSWGPLYARLDELYRGDLLPSERSNGIIVQARRDYRGRLVDALVTASERFFEKGDIAHSLWFAQAALTRDTLREDAYTALMQAQIAAGQRTAALDTYFRCRRYLTEELGIDPSKRTISLYHIIIDEKQGVRS